MSFGSPEAVVADARAQLTRGEFDRRKLEVTGAHPGAVLVRQGAVTLAQSSGSVTGLEATFSFSGDFGGQNRALGSELYVFCFVGQGWALEYRFSYPRETVPRGEIDGFMRDPRLTLPM